MPPSPALTVLTHEFFPFRGGIAVYVEETARAAAARHAVTVWAPAHPALLEPTWPFAVRPLPLRGTQAWRDRFALARAVHAARAELAHSILWLPEPGALLTAMYLHALRRLPARRLVLTLHGSEILRFSSLPHRRRLFQKLLDRAARVGVVSRYVRDLLHKKFAVDAAKVILVPGALRSGFVDTQFARVRPAAGAPVVLLTVARVHPRKGQHSVLEALTLLAKNSPTPFEYRIVGPLVHAAYHRKLQKLARESGATVRFLGEVPDADLPALYSQADIFVMTPVPHGPSLEGFGLVYLEAAAHGLPTVAHRTGGVPEAVRDGVTGLLVDPADRPALAAAIARLINEPALRANLAAAARVRARERSWADNANALFNGLD
jgi:glycosyltransferase involved in cell wall biosynthesis